MISRQRQLDLLTTALEGGSNYWYLLSDLSMVPKKGYTPVTKETLADLDLKDCLVYRIWEAVQNGAEVPVSDYGAEGTEVIGKLTKKGLSGAGALMMKQYPEHFKDVKNENEDATTADVFLQLAVLGEVIYG